MLAIFATLCAVGASDSCREAMLPLPEPGACAAPLEAARAWIDRQPEPLSLEGAVCREAGAGLDFDEVAPGVFVHVGRIAVPSSETGGDLSNMAFVVGERAVAIIDSGGSRAFGEAALRGLREITDLPIAYAFLGHMHPDHVYGATVFAEAGAEIVAHEDFAAALATRDDGYRESFARLLGTSFLGSAAPQVDTAVDAARTFDLGGRTLRAVPEPTAHTDNDLLVADETSGTLFASDLVFLGHIPALDGALRGWQSVLAEIATLDARLVVPGHGPVAPFPDALVPTRDYLDALARGVTEALDAGLSLAAAAGRIAQEQRPDWQLFDEYNERNATAAYVELEWE